MLSRFDDYPIHQTPEPIAHRATSDPNAYDRYWFNGLDRDGGFYFGAALGLYPHQQVMDAHFSILRDGEQHALHTSRLAPREPSDTAVGPIRLEVVEPMRRLRLTIARNDTGIEAELGFVSRAPALEEARARMKAGATTRNLIDMTRFTQFGTWQGWIRAGGVETRVDAARTFATRDRSWGVRPVGARHARSLLGRATRRCAGARPPGRSAAGRLALGPDPLRGRGPPGGLLPAPDRGALERRRHARSGLGGSRARRGSRRTRPRPPRAAGRAPRLPPRQPLDRARDIRCRDAWRREEPPRARDRAALQHERPRLRAPALGPRALAGRARRRGRELEGERPAAGQSLPSAPAQPGAREARRKARRGPARADPARPARGL